MSCIQPMRVDALLTHCIPTLSRHKLTNALQVVLVNSQKVKYSHRVNRRDHIRAILVPLEAEQFLAVNGPLDILYEDRHLLVLNKPINIAVHPGYRTTTDTIAQRLHYHYPELANEHTAETWRAGIVHRLDKDTSGVLIVAKRAAVVNQLKMQFQRRIVHKRYVAIVSGILTPPRGSCINHIARDTHDRTRFCVAAAGRLAHTNFQVITHTESHSVVLLYPVTGRTHQLRVQMRHLGYSIVGDRRYASRVVQMQSSRLLLHAHRIIFEHPIHATALRIAAPLPNEFKQYLRRS